jgi:hypothetical protein
MELFFVASAKSTGSNNVVSSSTANAIAIMDWSGSSGVVDVYNTNANASSGTGASNNITVASTTTNAADLVIGGFGMGIGEPSAMTAGTNVAWAASDTGTSTILSEYFVQSSAGAIVTDGNQPGGSGYPYGGVMTAFKPAAASCTSHKSLLGTGCI